MATFAEVGELRKDSQVRVAKTPQTYKPGLEEGFGQTIRKVLCISTPRPFSWESGNQFMNRFFKTVASSYKNPTNLQTWFGGRFLPNNEEGLCGSPLIPFSRGSRNQFMNGFLKTVASLILKPG